MGRLATEIKANSELLAQKNFNPKIEQERNEEIKRLEETRSSLGNKLEEIQQGNPVHLHVNFTTPSPDFDRNLVRGRILKLFTIKEDKYAQALETVAGGALYSVVVETEAVASALLKRNCFRHRETLIPNNKIQSRDVPRELIDYVGNVT